MSIRRIEHDSEAQWLETRRNYLTASDAAVVCNKSTFKSKYRLACEKTGAIESRKMDPLQMKWGHAQEATMERWFAEWFEEEYGEPATVTNPGEYTMFVNTEYPWLAATPDRDVESACNGHGLLECKSRIWGHKEWEEGPPVDVQVQTQQQMLCCGTDHCYIGAIVGTYPRIFLVERHQKFIDELLRATEKFWSDLQQGIMPEVDDSEHTTDALNQLFSTHDGTRVVLNNDFIKLDERRTEIAEELKALEKEKRKIDNRIREAIGSHSEGALPDCVYKLSAVDVAGYVKLGLDHVPAIDKLGVPYKLTESSTQHRLTRRKS